MSLITLLVKCAIPGDDDSYWEEYVGDLYEGHYNLRVQQKRSKLVSTWITGWRVLTLTIVGIHMRFDCLIKNGNTHNRKQRYLQLVAAGSAAFFLVPMIGADKGDLSGIKTSGIAQFNGIRLNGADFRNSKLQEAQFNGAELNGTNFRNSKLQEAQFNGAELNGTNFKDSELQEAHLNQATLDKADLSNSNLSSGHLEGASLNKANLSHSILSEVNLANSDLDGATLRGSNLRNADFSNSSLIKADLNGVDFAGAILRGTDLREADLSAVEISTHGLKENQLEDAKLCKTKLPDGVNLNRNRDC